jgi:methylated-DNA-[protein]-cysteine S-methyltransferase
MLFTFKTTHICPKTVSFEITNDGILKNVSFVGGCPGNLIAIGRLTEGKNANEVADILEGVPCGKKLSSCSDTLAKNIRRSLKRIQYKKKPKKEPQERGNSQKDKPIAWDKIISAPIELPVGTMNMVSDGERIMGLWFSGDPKEPPYLKHVRVKPDFLLFKDLRTWLNSYFAGEKPALTLDLRLYGSHFQNIIWDILKTIPYGEVWTYLDVTKEYLARTNISRMSSRAVAGAISATPVSILVPSHRVISQNKRLSGYGGGQMNKRRLLELEGHAFETEKRLI